MINYFFCPQTFDSEVIDEMVRCLNDLNEAVLYSNSRVEKFYHDQSLYSLYNKDGNMVYQMICNANPELCYRVLPAMFRRFQVVPSDVICEDLNVLKVKFPIECCLFGMYHNPIDRYHIGCVADFLKSRILIARSMVTPNTFKELSSMLFNKIKFTNNALRQYLAMEQGQMNNLLNVFIRMDDYCMNWNEGSIQVSKMQSDYGIVISDESDTVKNDGRLSAQRKFFVTEKWGMQYCFQHVKFGALRIYIFPDTGHRMIFVTYIGKHLSTKKFKC